MALRSRLPAAATATGGVDVADEVPGFAVVDELGHGPAVVGDDRGAARHCFYDAVTEGLLEVDEVQECVRCTEDGTSTRCFDCADVADAVIVDVRRDLVAEVTLVLDDAGDHEGPTGRRATSIAWAVPLSGWMRPKNSRYSSGFGCTANASTSMPWWIVAA